MRNARVKRSNGPHYRLPDIDDPRTHPIRHFATRDGRLMARASIPFPVIYRPYKFRRRS